MASDLTKEQLKQIQKVWNHFDKDQSGLIDLSELDQVVSELGLNATQEELDQLLSDFDTNQDGVIDYEEFLTLMAIKLRDA